MLKISFWLKKSDSDQGNLEYITITNPKIVKIEDTWKGCYACDVYLSDIKYNHPPIYGTNPLDTLKLALEIVKIYLQGFVNLGYSISEVESREVWKLGEKKDPILAFREGMDELKNNQNIPPEDRQKISAIMKDNFGKIPHVKDYFK